MKIADIFKIAWHNLWNNKSRTLLTVIIVAVVSTLMMTILLFGTAFNENVVDFNKALFKINGTSYSLSGKWTESHNTEDYFIAAEEYRTLVDTAEKYAHVVDTASVSAEVNGGREKDEGGALYISEGNAALPQNNVEFNVWQRNDDVEMLSSSNVVFACFEFFNPAAEDLIYEGRGWSAADAGGNGIWLSVDAAERFVGYYDDPLEVGDTVTIAFVRQSTYFTDFRAEKAVYTVEGIFRPDAFGGETDSFKRTECIVGVDSAAEAFGDLFTIRSVSMSYSPPETEYDYNALFSAMRDFADEVNEKIEPNVNNAGDRYPRFVCSFVDSMQMVVLGTVLVFAVASLLSLIVLLLSVGSVANTIVISVDKDRKFLGLMKAMGLKRKGVSRIVICQSLFMIAAGVVLGIAFLYLLRPVVRSAIASFITSMAGMSLPILLSVRVSPLLPVATAAAFFLAAVLFSRGSVDRIARQDAIAAINEVS